MDKKALISKYEGQASWLKKCIESDNSDSYKRELNDRLVIYIQMVSDLKQLEESEITEEQDISTLSKTEIVEIPEFVADYIKHCKKLGWAFSKAITHDVTTFTEVVDYLHVGKDSDKHQEMFAKAWYGDYNIEPEPRWVVKFKDHEDGEILYFSGFYKNDKNPLRPDGYSGLKATGNIKFTDKSKADAAALLIGGTVELVEGWEG